MVFYRAADPNQTLVFAAIMGFLWLGVGPLIAGSVAEIFGLQWQAMIQGLAFMSHQIGSFVGAFGGGVLFDTFGSYDLAWRLAVMMGLTAGVVQIVFALARPPHYRRREPDEDHQIASTDISRPPPKGNVIVPKCCAESLIKAK
jgi:predicted MFS family arabinose efflux permease